MKWSIGGAATLVFALGTVLATTALSQTPANPPADAKSAAQAPAAGRGGAGRGPAGPSRGEIVFNERCKTCHEPAVSPAPGRGQLAALWGTDVVKVLKTGSMSTMAAGLSDADINAIATFLTGRAPDAAFDVSKEANNPCAASNKFRASGPSWNGWSPDKSNNRIAASTTITAANAPRLKVKWAFAYQGARYGQPTQFGNRVFVTSSTGRAYGLDRETGCIAWRFDAKTSMRVTASVGRNARAKSGYAVYFGDFDRNVYAVDAGSGEKIWEVNVDSQPRGILTGAPTLYGDMLYVPVSSLEEFTGTTGVYECCKARGSVVAVNVKTGAIKWKTYAIPIEPKPFRKNSLGTQMYGPAGGAVWNSPTIDPKRKVLYITTGDSYTDVREDYTDGIVAMNLETGNIVWHKQMTADDSFMVGCGSGPTNNCPTAQGPDHDFGASAILTKRPDGKEIIVIGQKSGQVYALDPDKKGEKLWETRIGMGSALGGVEWGMAADNRNVYVAVNQGNADTQTPSRTPGGPGRSLTALDLMTGRNVWQHLAPSNSCTWSATQCRSPAGYSGPPTLANGVLYGVNIDGHVRAFTALDGKMIWDFDTGAQKYDTVNGVKNQRGGNLDATGITFAGDMAFLMAGFSSFSSSAPPDNVLLAFTVDGK